MSCIKGISSNTLLDSTHLIQTYGFVLGPIPLSYFSDTFNGDTYFKESPKYNHVLEPGFSINWIDIKNRKEKKPLF